MRFLTKQGQPINLVAPRSRPAENRCEPDRSTRLMSDMVLAACAAGTFVLVIGAYSVRVTKLGRAHDARLDREPNTGATIRFIKEAIHWFLRAIATELMPRWVTPDELTVVGLLVTLGCIPLVACGHFGAAALLFLGASAFDVLDGAVARARGLSSQSGEMLDAVVDRYEDVAPLAGLALFYRNSSVALCIVLLTMVGSLLVSYVRAKAESCGLDLPSGFMRRPERTALLVGSLALGSLLPVNAAGLSRVPTLAVLLVVGVLSHRDAMILLRQARRQLRASESVVPPVSDEGIGHERSGVPDGDAVPRETLVAPSGQSAGRR